MVLGMGHQLEYILVLALNGDLIRVRMHSSSASWHVKSELTDLGHCKLSFGTKKSVSSDKTDSSVPFMWVVLCDQLPAKKSTRNTVSFLLSDRPWTTGTLICHHTCQHSRCWFHLLRTELKISQRGVTSSAFFSFWVITLNTREIILLCRHPFTVNRMNVLCWNKGLLQNHYSIHH